ncbi:MAG TPA: hypothetical protein VF026_18070 [Ktedonobacteraceae bacterium]
MQEDHDEAFLPFVGIIIAELTSATVVSQRTLPVMSLHSQMVHGEEAREQTASAGQAIPLQGIGLLAFLRSHTRQYHGGRASKATAARLHRHTQEGLLL